MVVKGPTIGSYQLQCNAVEDCMGENKILLHLKQPASAIVRCSSGDCGESLKCKNLALTKGDDDEVSMTFRDGICRLLGKSKLEY